MPAVTHVLDPKVIARLSYAAAHQIDRTDFSNSQKGTPSGRRVEKVDQIAKIIQDIFEQ